MEFSQHERMNMNIKPLNPSSSPAPSRRVRRLRPPFVLLPHYGYDDWEPNCALDKAIWQGSAFNVLDQCYHHKTRIKGLLLQGKQWRDERHGASQVTILIIADYFAFCLSLAILWTSLPLKGGLGALCRLQLLLGRVQLEPVLRSLALLKQVVIADLQGRNTLTYFETYVNDLTLSNLLIMFLQGLHLAGPLELSKTLIERVLLQNQNLLQKYRATRRHINQILD